MFYAKVSPDLSSIWIVENWGKRNWERENGGENDIFSYLDNRRKFEREKTEGKKSSGTHRNFFLLTFGEKTRENLLS